jgi:cytochrome c553
MTIRSAVTFSILLWVLLAGGNATGEPAGKGDYLADCARCHGVDGKGSVPEMSAVPGYISVDLTQLSKKNDGQFPRQEVYDAIDGRKRFPAHFIGDMPT